MPQMPRPPETKPAALRFSARDVKFILSSPAFVLVALALAAAPGLVGVLTTTPKLEHGPTPLPSPQVPLLETTPAGALPMLAAMLPSALPSPGPNQKRAGTCDPERAQVELAGGCWVETKTTPPCPRGKQWEHEGRCWLPVADAKPVPTSGERRPLGIADP